MRRYLLLCLLALLTLGGCRGRAADAALDTDALAALVDSLVPHVEKAVGFSFTSQPKFAIRTKAEVQTFLLAKLDQEMPESRTEGIEAAYRLLELIPDTLRIRDALLPLYAEQVAGYYDPDSTTLYAVEGAKSDQLRLVLAHELVHALQHEQLPLDRLLKHSANSDRLAAVQAVLEGHATLAMLGVMLAGQADAAGGVDGLLANPGFWQQYREQVRASQSSMPVFRAAPLVLREGLIFPYLGGAEFMRWWSGQPGKGSLPTLEQLPQSTEQVLHPIKYLNRDQPVTVAFADSAASPTAPGGVMHEDTMGELELQIWAAELRGGGEVLDHLPMGWGGDRFRVYRSAAGPALVLYSVWDDSTSARRFATLTGDRFAERARYGYRTEVTRLELDGRPGVRIVRAPTGWSRWDSIPSARATLP
ncbi:MAG: hypothetical protein KF785_08420 [Gemmatimonadales bacterium]|nr:hypothetical protein [Gemmatimonadales bacterium]